jgi:hypothetical protein
VSLNSRNYFNVIPAKPGDSWREPESRNFEEFWIPAFAVVRSSSHLNAFEKKTQHHEKRKSREPVLSSRTTFQLV